MIRIKLPATSANLGPGFDCMGLALDLWNTFELRLEGEVGTVEVETLGEGADVLPKGRTNLLAETVLDDLKDMVPKLGTGLRIVCRNDVPCASGLGSSSTAVLAGLVFAAAVRAYAVGEPSFMDALERRHVRDEVLEKAIRLEGHGDNVAPALLGGLILVTSTPQGALIRRIETPPIKVTVCVPKFNFLTTQSRAAVPTEIPKPDAVHNIARALFVAEALRDGDLALLAKAAHDRLHEPYRVPRIPGAKEARQAALDAGAAAVMLSGAGPGLIAFASGAHAQIGEAMIQAFAEAGLSARAWVLDTAPGGAVIEEAP